MAIHNRHTFQAFEMFLQSNSFSTQERAEHFSHVIHVYIWSYYQLIKFYLFLTSAGLHFDKDVAYIQGLIILKNILDYALKRATCSPNNPL